MEDKYISVFNGKYKIRKEDYNSYYNSNKQPYLIPESEELLKA